MLFKITKIVWKYNLIWFFVNMVIDEPGVNFHYIIGQSMLKLNLRQKVQNVDR